MSEKISIHFWPDIRAHGQAVGRKFSPQDVDAIDAGLNSIAVIKGNHLVGFDLGDGRMCDLGEAVTMMSVGLGKQVAGSAPSTPASTPPSTPSLPANATPTERAIARVRADRANRDRETAAAIVAESGNPWIAGPNFNRTAQAVISNKDQSLAVRLKNEANVR